MVRPGDLDTARQFADRLADFSARRVNLHGIDEPGYLNSLVEQLIESQRRVKYMAVIRERDVSARRADPRDFLFDPLKAAVYYQQLRSVDEAFWMVFFFTHFGRHRRGGWRYAREVYRGQGALNIWDWATTSANPLAFRHWLHANQDQILNPALPGGFGNHRKYQSLDAWHGRGTGAAFQTYVQWINPPRTHAELMQRTLQDAGGDPREAFRLLFDSMNVVASFGRLARFDYLATVRNLGLANIEPDSPHLEGATGALNGARLLFGPGRSPRDMNARLIELGESLEVGMQVIEDALCNWQKSPQVFVPYRG